MIVLLPNTRNGLPALESKLKTIRLSMLASRMWNKEIIVSLPKFKIEFEIDLPKILMKVNR